ncbi:uncharacterized protein LOC131630543 [Vicia villosa]|uniref:uncharacterized protein LOC131630543 n=1 Tax=Vicia villosa TaxID=3911 RepID=UPI00273C9F02|nr:uncharacterized protein LOC131630543 [Vicia villosa]
MVPGPSSPPCKKLGQQIWKAPIHNRVRNFLWRAAKNIFPTKQNLMKKGIRLDSICSLCNKDVENVHHLFMECEFAKTFCFSSVLSYRTPKNIEFNDWLLSILSCGDVLSLQLLCTLVYKIWLSRNLKLYQMKDSLPVTVAKEAVDSMVEFNNWNVVSRRENLEKIASEPSKKEIIIKKISITACKREEVSVEVAVGEEMAIRWGLYLAKELQLERIVLKTDARVVVDCVTDVRKLAVLVPVVLDIKSMLSCFNFSSLLFHSRSCNVEAHNLARFAYVVGSKSWIREYPSMEAFSDVPIAVLFH